LFFVGPTAKPGLFGAHPSLDDLDDGDLKSHTDFRRVYSTIVTDWLHSPVEPVVGMKYDRIPSLIRT
jgi:uncharacterized protein (DUF1501 family)